MSEAQDIIATALARTRAREAATPRIDYARMKREHPKLKAALTRAKNSRDPEKVILACRNAVKVWDEVGCWPDCWHTWQNALDAVLPWNQHVELSDLR